MATVRELLGITEGDGPRIRGSPHATAHVARLLHRAAAAYLEPPGVWGGYPRPTGRLFATAARKQAHYRLAPRRVPHQTRIAVAACSPSNLFNLFNLT
jgi:hypothetical protein